MVSGTFVARRLNVLILLSTAVLIAPTLTGGPQAAASMTSTAVEDHAARVEELGSADPEVRDAAKLALQESGAAATEALLEGLDHAQTLVRWSCVRLLGNLDNPELGDRFKAIMNSDDYQIVRRAAAIALGRSKAEGAREALLEFMRTDAIVGAEALGLLGDREALLDLQALLVTVVDRFDAFLETRKYQPEVVRAQEGPMAGSLAIIGGALARLGARGAVKPLLTSLKYTEWVGMYARKMFKEYMGDDMPAILPPSARGPNRDVLQAQVALIGFWDLKYDFYVHPDEDYEFSESTTARCREMLRDMVTASDEQRDRVAAIFVSLGRPSLRILLDEYSNPDSPLYLSERIRRIVYEMGSALKAKRTPRLTRRVVEALEKEIRETSDIKVRAGLIDLIADMNHWFTYEREVVNLSHQYDDETYMKISEMRLAAKDLVLSYLAEDKTPEEQVIALKALVKLGDEDLAEPVGNLLATTDSDEVRKAAIHCLEWIRFESGRAMLQSSGLLEGDYSDGVKLHAARSLALVGDGQGIPLLLDALRSDDVNHRKIGADTLRAVANRYLGYDAENPSEEAIARWNRWYESSFESLRIDITRIRENEFHYFNHPLQRRIEIEETLDNMLNAESSKDKHWEFKHLYAYQQQFLPIMLERYAGLEGDDKAMVGNMILTRFNRRLSLPFVADLLANETDAQMLVAAMDAITLTTTDTPGFTQDEADAFIGPVRALLEDETQTHLVRVQAAATLGQLGEVDGIPYLIECLTLTDEVDDAGWLRDEAFRALRKLRRMAGLRQEFGYEPNAPQVVKEAAAQSFREWWEGAEADFELTPEWAN